MLNHTRNIHTVECGTCGEEFVPAPYNVYKKYGRHYCSYTCYNNAVRKKPKLLIAFGIETYMEFDEMAHKLIDILERKGIPCENLTKRFLFFETKHIRVQFIPFSKDVRGCRDVRETFGVFKDEKTPKYLRRNITDPPYDGDIVSYILSKESMY